MFKVRLTSKYFWAKINLCYFVNDILPFSPENSTFMLRYAVKVTKTWGNLIHDWASEGHASIPEKNYHDAEQFVMLCQE